MSERTQRGLRFAQACKPFGGKRQRTETPSWYALLWSGGCPKNTLVNPYTLYRYKRTFSPLQRRGSGSGKKDRPTPMVDRIVPGTGGGNYARWLHSSFAPGADSCAATCSPPAGRLCESLH